MDNRIDKVIISSLQNIFTRTIILVGCLYLFCGLMPQKYIPSPYQYYHVASVAIIVVLSLIHQFLVIRATDVIEAYQTTLNVKQRVAMFRKTGTSGFKMLFLVACVVIAIMLTETVLLPINASIHLYWAVTIGTILSLIFESANYTLTYINFFKFITNISSED